MFIYCLQGDNAVIFYEIVQGDDAFGVYRDTGVISVKSPSLLDRETVENFTILVSHRCSVI